MFSRWFVVFSCLVFIFCGCGRPSSDKNSVSKNSIRSAEEKDSSQESAENENENKNSVFRTFYIYKDKGSRENHYVPSGFMPNGNCLSFDDSWHENCHNGKTCIKIVYDTECSRHDQKWAGIYWLSPPNNWGSRKGGYNLTDANRLTFWARGEKGGEQIQEFTIGGISGDFPDSDTVVIGPVILTSKWRQYTMDLRGKDLSYISGGFSWTTSESVNAGFSSCVFYLDDVKFE